MVDALIQSREGTIVVPENLISPFFTNYAPALPTTIDAKESLERWEPWVRAVTTIGEMLQGISFAKTTTGTTEDGLQVLSSGTLIAEIRRPKQKTFEDQIPMVLSWAELRSERATEIMAQIDPPYAFWSSIIYMHPDRTKRTFELVNMVLQFCVYVEMRVKHALACWRPVEYNAEVQPMITTPGHGTFPMGHATQVYAVATVLQSLLALNPGFLTVIQQLQRQAARITTNRVIAGVHFPVDSMAGRMLGVALGEYFVARCTGATTFTGRKFVASAIDGAPATDFNPFKSDQDLGTGPFYAVATSAGSIPTSDLMQFAWCKAQREWAGKYGVPAQADPCS
jgi:hypothetical protein